MHLCTSVSEEGDDGETPSPETTSLLSYTLRYISFSEVGSVCRVVLREPIHLCTCVIEEGGDGEPLCPETPSLLSYTLHAQKHHLCCSTYLDTLVFVFLFIMNR